MNTIQMPVLAKHFIDTEFLNLSCDCALEKAAKDFFTQATKVKEHVHYLNIDRVLYNHDYYGVDEFDADKKLATETLKNDPEGNTLIRTIKLEKP